MKTSVNSAKPSFSYSFILITPPVLLLKHVWSIKINSAVSQLFFLPSTIQSYIDYYFQLLPYMVASGKSKNSYHFEHKLMDFLWHGAQEVGKSLSAIKINFANRLFSETK